ncbi:MAG: sigma-70 family RNA polymerase sigma factor [Planctomycetes bacterium]|nr:sigma-70 family RNA polymerase sigma factor [Planctomycetota bacterium]
MLRVRDDDSTAFGELVERFQHRLVAVMHHLIGSADEAEDLAQEVFLRVYRNRKKYTPKAKLSTWLFTIANNLALNALRDRKRRPVLPLEINESGPIGTRSTEVKASTRDQPPAHQLQQQELAEVIRRSLDGLNERQRVAIVLNKFEDMNYTDIAEVMGLTSKAVKSLLSRARAKLREALQGYIYMDAEPPPPTGDDADIE